MGSVYEVDDSGNVTAAGAISGKTGSNFGDGGSTNYSEFESDGTLKYNGNATVFKDINLGAAQLGTPAVNAPDIDEFVDNLGADTGIETLAFAPAEHISGDFEIQHDYKEGTDVVFHIHWQGIAAPTGTDKVQWQLTYTVADEETTLAPVTTITIETDFDTQYEFKRSDFAAISGTGLEIGDQFLFRLERIAASVDEYAGDALIATVGLHYETDTTGSRQITTK
jgi:hypothetical protein